MQDDDTHNRFGELYIHWSAECHKGFRAIEGTSSHLGVVFITVLGLESTTKLMTNPLFLILGSLFGHALGVMAWRQILFFCIWGTCKGGNNVGVHSLS